SANARCAAGITRGWLWLSRFSAASPSLSVPLTVFAWVPSLGGSGAGAGVAGLGLSPVAGALAGAGFGDFSGGLAPDSFVALSKCAITSPTFTIAPLALRILVSVPAVGAGNSTVAFSDSMVTTFSSLATASPSALSHWPICTSVMDSPRAGIFSSVGMSVLSLGRRMRARAGLGEGLFQKALLFLLVAVGRAAGGAGGFGGGVVG